MVTLVVAMSGWFVKRTSPSDLKVLSGKEVCPHITKEPSRLIDKVIGEISYQLEQRCRDVEI